MSVLLIGAGKIARFYLETLVDLKADVTLVGRGNKNIDKIKDDFIDLKTVSGGIENFLNNSNSNSFDCAIIASPIESLFDITKHLINHGIKNILVEKPLTFEVQKAEELLNQATKNNSKIFIAFNRRNYASILKAKEIIESDGGANSVYFNFTEAIDRILFQKFSEYTLSRWGIANSSHVIDSVFFLCGRPKTLDSVCYQNNIEWHPSGSGFMGKGRTEKNIPFLYNADWECPGRWSIEIMTRKNKIILSPMEELRIQRRGSFKEEKLDLVDEYDLKYKPGFYLQTQKFIEGEDGLLALEDYIKNLNWLNKIFKYEN